MASVDENSWRAIIAALAHDTARRAYAEIVVHGDSPTLAGLSPSRRRHITDALVGCGLVTRIDGMLQLHDGVFADALRAAPTLPRRQGLARFLDGDGRILAYPADPTVRHELLAWIAREAVSPDEVLSESALNARLDVWTADVAVLRRALVDAGELERTRSGSEYARPPASTQS